MKGPHRRPSCEPVGLGAGAAGAATALAAGFAVIAGLRPGGGGLDIDIDDIADGCAAAGGAAEVMGRIVVPISGLKWKALAGVTLGLA